MNIEPPVEPSLRTGNRTLPVRPRPTQKEAKIGYMSRVAKENGFTTYQQLQMSLHRGNTQKYFDGFCEQLLLSKSERRALFGPSPRFWGPSELPPGMVPDDFNHRIVRWCPGCLANSGVIRGPWALKLYCACTSHGVLLCDRCPKCQRKQRLEYGEIRYCLCGFWLGAAPTPTASGPLLRLHEAINASIFGGDIPVSFPELDVAAWQRVIRYLGPFTENSPPTYSSGRISGLHRLATASTVITGAAHLLDQWPNNFNGLLASIQNRKEVAISVRRTFGRLYRVLYVNLSGDCFQFLRDAFEDYLLENWPGFVCKRNRLFKPATVANHPRLTITQAASLAGTAPSVVRHLLQATLIAGGEASLPSGRKTRAIHKRDVQRISALAKGGVTLEEAAHLLALPKCRVRELVASNVIVPSVSRTQRRASSWLIPKKQIDQFLCLPRKTQDDNCLISLRQIMKYWRLRKGESVGLVQALLKQELVAATASTSIRTLGELQLNSNEVQNWLSAWRMRTKDDLSISQAAEALGIKQEVAYALVRNGFLAVTLSGSLGRRVHHTALQEFRSSYVALVELARERRRSPKSLLAEIDAMPVCGPSVDGTRQYFFRRGDLQITKG